MFEANLDVQFEARLMEQEVFEPPTPFVERANRPDACKRAAGGV